MRVQLANVFGVLIPLLVTACTPFEDKQGNALVDLDDLWVITGYPCDGRTPPLLARIKQFGKELTATSLQQHPCFEVGQEIWIATLPRSRVTMSELPVAFRVELTPGPGRPTVKGEGTIASSDRMLLDVGSTPLVVTRAIPSDANKLDKGGSEGAPEQLPRTDAGATMVPSGAAGATAQAGGSAHQWYCLPFQTSCTCVADLGASGDSCTKPKPSCCVMFVGLGQLACECWPADSEECKTRETEAPDSKLVPTCPPP